MKPRGRRITTKLGVTECEVVCLQEAAELKHHPEEQQQEDADQSSSEGKVSNLRRIRVKIMVIHSGTASTDKDRTVMEHSPLLKIRRPAGTSHLRNTIVNRTLCNSRRVTEKLSNSDGRRQVARIRDFILCTLAIISNDHLQSRRAPAPEPIGETTLKVVTTPSHFT